MKKNLVIGLLAIVALLSLAFGYYEKVRADKFEEELVKELLKKEEILKHGDAVFQEMKRKFEAKESIETQSQKNTIKK